MFVRGANHRAGVRIYSLATPVPLPRRMSLSSRALAERSCLPTRSSTLAVTSCAILASSLLFGCSTVKTKPLTRDEVLSSSKAASADAQQGVEPLTGPLTLDEALARAFRHNLHRRAQQLEEAIAMNLWTAGKFDILPRTAASAGYRWRDSELITRSRDSVTGRPSLANPYISSEREATHYDLGASWSVLDLAVGYYTAKQNSNRILIAMEHRRKAMHGLNRDVTLAFWRMASSQKLLEDVRRTIAAAEGALADASQAQSEGLRSPVDNLRYQRQLLENIRLLASIEKEFSTARMTLANLINVPLQTEFAVVEPSTEANIRILDVPVEAMEELAIVQNADLREHIYNQRIAVDEARKTLAKLMPNLSLSYSLKHTSDSYLINNTWGEAGVLVSQNLTNLLSLPAQKRVAQGGIALTHQRRVAAQVALLAQVHIARIELANSHRQLMLADRIWTLDQGIKQYTSNRQEAEADSKLSRVAADTASIVSMLRRYQALAEFNAAAGALQSTLGMEIDVAKTDRLSLPELSSAIRSSQDAWQQGRLPTL
jgi:outer membrane protein TolC